MQVSRSGFYDYLERKRRAPDPIRMEMIAHIKTLAKESRYTYGTRRMTEALQKLNYSVGRFLVRRLMREAGVAVRYRRKYRVTTDSSHKRPVVENLLMRNFSTSAPNQVWVSDITYINTREGWLYLAVVMDLYSRRVVGWAMSNRIKGDLVCDAMRMAIAFRRPKPNQLIHHSDRGSQYASRAFCKLLKTYKIKGSMSRKGDCWDNAVIESFFGSLKNECVYWKTYSTREQARHDIVDYITMFYNSHRMHSYLDYSSPNNFEMNNYSAKAA